MNATYPFSETAAAGGLWRAYQPLTGIHDEMMAADGSLRGHWQGLIQGLEAMTSEGLDNRLRKAERLLQENGLTTAVSGTVVDGGRPWELDFVPLILPASERGDLEAGLIQRARLLNAILADLYGPQRLLREGHLPAALVFANPHFLRPCHGIVPKDGVFLHTYAADLGRGPDGRWWVLADRTQAPAGVGYALENRIVLSQSLPELFRREHIHRLATYFQAMHNSLMARTGRYNPRIVQLTPGPDIEGYFDHAYLARYLGYTLAGGSDLTVRDDRVYLKTVDGLKPVDLILRGIEAEQCDSLEFHGQSNLGVPGLVRAARAGTVTMANALGSGVAETRALMAFMPALCRVLFDEELILPNTATWWCGQKVAAAYVREHLEELAIDLAFERRPLLARSRRPVLGSDLTAGERDAVTERLAVKGHAYVAQELVSLSTTPVWLDGALRPRPMSVRMFLAAADSGYVMMQGGLTRVSASKDARAVSLRRGEGAKDTWMLSDQPVPGLSLLGSSRGELAPRRTSKDIPSHSADNLFWLGRYAERAEDMMRVLRSVLRRLTEEIGDAKDVAVMERVVQVLLEKTGIGPPTADEKNRGPTVALERQIQSLMFTPDCPYGLQETLGNLGRTASLSRDWLSVEAWRILSRLHIDMTRPLPSGALNVGEALEHADNGIQKLAAFSGMEMENMTRDHGWRFLDMGRRLERALHLSKVLSRLLVWGDPEDHGSLVLLLEVADSIMTYRWRYLTTPKVAPVIDLLLLDDSNPRSVAFQVTALDQHVDNLPREVQPPARSEEQRIMLSLLTNIRLAEIPVLCQQGGQGRRGELDALLDQVQKALPRFSEAIARSFFSHAEVHRPADLIRD